MPLLGLSDTSIWSGVQPCPAGSEPLGSPCRAVQPQAFPLLCGMISCCTILALAQCLRLQVGYISDSYWLKHVKNGGEFKAGWEIWSSWPDGYRDASLGCCFSLCICICTQKKSRRKKGSSCFLQSNPIAPLDKYFSPVQNLLTDTELSVCSCALWSDIMHLGRSTPLLHYSALKNHILL